MLSIPFEEGSPLGSDESLFLGKCDIVYLPNNTNEAVEAVEDCLNKGYSITPQGARTGMCGAACPEGGAIISTSRMSAPLSVFEREKKFFLRVESGCTLETIKTGAYMRRWGFASPIPDETLNALKHLSQLSFPPDPSEESASAGGLFSTNAAGPNLRKYGRFADYVEALEIIIPDFGAFAISRGQYVFDRGQIGLPHGGILRTDPQCIGLSCDADLIDLLAGSEGMLGVITFLTLRLEKPSNEIWAICFFFDSEESAANCIDIIESRHIDSIAELDFIDSMSLKLIAELKKVAAKLKELPDAPKSANGAVCIELHAATELEAEEIATELMLIAEDCSSDPNESWAFSGEREVRKLRVFKHSIQEAINALLVSSKNISTEAMKFASDCSLPRVSFSEALKMYKSDAMKACLETAIFGHAKNSQLNVNIISKSERDNEVAQKLLKEWAQYSVSIGGAPFAKWGVGKIKRDIFLGIASKEELAAILALKAAFDPKGILNPGNMIRRSFL